MLCLLAGRSSPLAGSRELAALLVAAPGSRLEGSRLELAAEASPRSRFAAVALLAARMPSRSPMRSCIPSRMPGLMRPRMRSRMPGRTSRRMRSRVPGRMRAGTSRAPAGRELPAQVGQVGQVGQPLVNLEPTPRHADERHEHREQQQQRRKHVPMELHSRPVVRGRPSRRSNPRRRHLPVAGGRVDDRLPGTQGPTLPGYPRPGIRQGPVLRPERPREGCWPLAGLPRHRAGDGIGAGREGGRSVYAREHRIAPTLGSGRVPRKLLANNRTRCPHTGQSYR